MKFKELLEVAKEHLKDLSPLENPDFRLEQAEYNKDENAWEIVVSFLIENTNKRFNPLTLITSEFEFHRIYKRIKFDNNNNIIGFYIFNKE
jgi:hypothetical protein